MEHILQRTSALNGLIKEIEVEAAPEEVGEEPAEVVDEAPVDDDVPSEHRSALRSVETYADMMHMSEAGIFDQLTSEYGGQFYRRSCTIRHRQCRS